MKIAKKLLNESLKITKSIFEMSSNLMDTEALYNDRRDSFLPLVGKKGYTEFHPEAEIQVLPTFRELFEPIVRDLHDDYFYHAQTEEEQTKAHNLYRLADLFWRHLTNEDIIFGRVPERCQTFVKNRDMKGFNSPKLSRWLSKLAPESSEFWAWYTNKCPKGVAKGVMKDFTLVVSVLPHHIAGMSYYSCYNKGGKRWNGWQGTSCQDPTRNNGGSAMLNLPASVKDETLAVAYLTTTEDHDIMNPTYEARALVRVVELSNGNVFYVVLRQFGYTESIAILLDGLKNKYDNVITNHDCREKYSNDSGKCVRIHMTIKDCRNTYKEKCGSCDGTGHRYGNETEGDCPHCEGTGIYQTHYYYPYNDDGDIWVMYNTDRDGNELDGEVRVMYRIPKQLLLDKGWYESKKIEEHTHPYEDLEDVA